MAEYRKTTEQPYISETKAAVAEMLGWPEPPKNGTGELAKDYLTKFLPAAMAKHGHVSSSDAWRSVKESHLDQNTFKNVIDNIAAWGRFSKGKAVALLNHTIPSLLAYSDINKSASEKRSINMALDTLTTAVGSGDLIVFSPLCPPYHYAREGGSLKHASAQIIPRIGSRFSNAVKSLKDTFAPLTDHGVDVNFEFATYTGETRNIDHLTDLGQDVMQHYQKSGFSQLFDNLQSAANDAVRTLDQSLRDSRISGKISSLENMFGYQIADLVNEFKTNFPNTLKGGHHNDHISTDIAHWLRSRLGASEDWLHMFIQEEKTYRAKQRSLISEGRTSEPLMISALNEGLLYLLTTVDATSSGKLVVDLETTHEYMVGSLRHLPAPVIMAAPYNTSNPNSPRGIRQPFNPPA